MSVIQKIRDKGAWIMFGLIALALIAFILQDRALGGGRGNGLMGGNLNTLGKVNGVTIDRNEFEQKLTMYGATGAQREQMIGQLWNAEVNSIIMQREYDKLGLAISGKELSELMFGENSPLRREFTDPQTGVFKEADARRAFDQLKKSKNTEQRRVIQEMYVVPAIQQAMQQKYQSLLQQAMYVPKWMIEKTQADNNTVSSVSYVYVPYSTITDSTIKVSDDEIIAYAKKHSKEYEREEESRNINYVSFDDVPSSADSAATLNQILSLKNEFQTTPEVKSFLAKVGSELQYNDSYINRKEIKQKAIDSIEKLAVGAIYGPYLDVNNYTLAKLIGVKQLPDSAKVRHILVATHQPDQQSGTLQRVREDSVARKIMDSVEMALKAGKPFDSVCAKYSDDGNKSKGGLYDYFPSGRMVPAFNEFSFEKPVGSKGVIKTEYGLHYVEVLAQKGSTPAYKVAYLAKPIVTSSETDNNVITAASQFIGSSKNKKQFDENLIKLNKIAIPATELKENDNSIPGLADSRQVIKWTYTHDAGDITDQAIKVGDKYIVAILTNIIKPGIPPATLLRQQVEPLVRNEKKATQIIKDKLKGNTIESIAAAAGTTVQKSDSLSFSNPFIPGVGNDGKFTGAAFNVINKGKLTQPVVGTSGVFVIRVENIGAKQGTADIETVKQGLIQSQRMALYRGSEALKKAATIKDYRSKFY
jgi:peptidyl-prolyl cis-trans isomerase D